MGVRKLGYLPHSTLEATESYPQASASGSSTGSWGSGAGKPGGYADSQVTHNRRVSFADQDHDHKLLEKRFLHRVGDQEGGHFPEIEFPPSETTPGPSYTYANSVCKHAERLEQVKVEDFLSACDFEVDRQKKRRCQKTQLSPLSASECEPEEGCVPCQVAQLKRDLLRRHSSGRWPDCKLCYRYRSQRATMKDIEEAKSIATPLCKKASLKDKAESLRTPPPTPVSVMAILASPRVTPSPVPLGTPDSEYDTGKRDQLIKKYLPQRKLTHYECQPRGQVFFYTEDTANQGIVHQPYHFHRRQAAITNSKRKPKSNTNTTYSVAKLGLLFTLPDTNNTLPGRHSVQSPRRWNNSTLLPPINVQKMEHVTTFSGRQSPSGTAQTRCSSATCS